MGAYLSVDYALALDCLPEKKGRLLEALSVCRLILCVDVKRSKEKLKKFWEFAGKSIMEYGPLSGAILAHPLRTAGSRDAQNCRNV